jgi:aryl-alcohol dehydrogenase-like predicted oxidoreductase
MTKPLPGQATPDATRAYSVRLWQANPKISPNAWRVLEGLTVGKVGVGGYRLSGTPNQKDALREALMRGCNLVDTSANYMDGQSEETIGQVLTELVNEDKVQRDEIVVVTKGGYIQGRLYQQLQNTPPAEVVQLGDGLWHCLHPDFIRAQVAASRARLGLETLDVYLLHNPEYFLMAEGGHEEYYRRLEEAFVALEELCQKGEMGCYGISSNTLVVPSDDPTFTDLNEVYAAAERAAQRHFGRKKRPNFRVIELPMNLVELGAVKELNHKVKNISFQPEAPAPVLELAVARHLSVLVNRPLNAFVEGHPLRLADAGEEVHLEDAINALAMVEHKIETLLKDWPTTEAGYPLLRLSGAADEILAHLNSVIAYDSLLGNLLLPQAGAMVQRLQAGGGQALVPLYTEVVQRFFAALKYQGQLKDMKNSAELRGELQKRLPESWQDAPLQQVALNAVASTPGVTSVLCGLRDKSYVEDAVAIYEKGDFVDVARVLGTPL